MKQMNGDIRKTIKISNADGVFAQIYLSLSGPGSIFLTKFAVLLNATSLQFGILSAIGQLSQVFQLAGVMITRRMTSRRGMVILLATLARTLTFLFGFLPFLLPKTTAIWILLLLFFIVTSLLAVSGNGWVAWISDMIPLRFRGRFFSRRTQYLMLAGLLTGYLVGGFIDLYGFDNDGFSKIIRQKLFGDFSLEQDTIFHAFAGIFCFASIMGLISSKILSKQPELPKQIEDEPLCILFTAPFKDRNFRRLLFYGVWWMLAIGIGAPFWQPFMMKNLKLSLVDIQIYGTISTIASLLVLRAWGHFIDRFGNKAAMTFAIILGGLNPLVWVFANVSNVWIIYIEAAGSGIMWSGANIVATNFVLAVAPHNKRQIYSGIFGAVSGASMMLTMIISGALVLPSVAIRGIVLQPEQILFAITGIMRWSTLLPLSLIAEKKRINFSEVMRYFLKTNRSKTDKCHR